MPKILGKQDASTDAASVGYVTNALGKKQPLLEETLSLPSGSLEANKHYILGTLTGSVVLDGSVTKEDMSAEIVIEFRTGSTPPTISWEWDASFVGGSAPEINANKYYEISIYGGRVVCAEFE